MDPLSDLLSLLKVQRYLSAGFDAGGDWAIVFGRHEGIKLHAVFSGECWLVVDGVPEPLKIKAGDCFLLPHGRSFRMATDLSLEPLDVQTLMPAVFDGSITSYQGGGGFSSVGGYFALNGEHAEILLALLPPVVHVRRESDKEVLRWCLERMRQEMRELQLGGAIVGQQLATMILVQVLRTHLADGAAKGTGWLYALTDRRMKAAISAMHADPAHRWTLQSLAKVAGMSRTTFALRFKETVGTAPIEYLSRWRMWVAADKLANSGESISAIALSLGYESESAFSTAFKRAMGTSPRRYGAGRPGNFVQRTMGRQYHP